MNQGIQANGVRFHSVESGRGPLVLCLHGFPDNALTYRHLIPDLARAGFWGVAPYMRGYAPTSLAPNDRYDLVHLAQDALALIDALVGVQKACLVGHDWGALATYAAAVLAPERILKIVTLAAPHPGMVFDAPRDYDFIRGSWHAYFFQLPFAEDAVAANDFEFLERLWHEMSPAYDPPSEIIASVKETFRQPYVLTAALNYYRHTVNPLNRDPTLAELHERVTTVPIAVPALGFHGMSDRPGRLAAF